MCGACRWLGYSSKGRSIASCRAEKFVPEASLTQIVRSTRIERHNAYPQLTVALARAMAAATSQAARQSATPHAEALQPLFGVQAPVSQPAMRDVLPPQELARVTEHVLAQLDRKVLSFRERHGRI